MTAKPETSAKASLSAKKPAARDGAHPAAPASKKTPAKSAAPAKPAAQTKKPAAPRPASKKPAARTTPAAKKAAARTSAAVKKTGIAKKPAAVKTASVTPASAKTVAPKDVATPRPAVLASTPPPAAKPLAVSAPATPSKTRSIRLKKWIPAFVLIPVLGAAGVLLVLNGVMVAPTAGVVPGAAAVSAPSAIDVPAAAAQFWVSANVPAEATVVSDGSAVLTDWREADYVVENEGIRTAVNAAGGSAIVGQAIANSVVVASFGTGESLVQVRHVSPEGAIIANATASRVAQTRTEYGSELAQNPALAISSTDRLLLSLGRVDARVALVLGSLAAGGEVSVAGFPVINGEQGLVLRQVALTSIDGSPLAAAGQFTPLGTAVIGSLTGSFEPAGVSVDGSNVVIRYLTAIDPLTD